MKDFQIIKDLVGEGVREEELEDVDCYVHKKAGIFIPSTGECKYAKRRNHTHPSYMVLIWFNSDGWDTRLDIEIKKNQYPAAILSPGIPHNDVDQDFQHYYCILIDREYFEAQFKLYSEENPLFEWKVFPVCHDILKALNTFAFEYSKEMQNSDITLDAQATILTHWIIRSLLGENMDMRMISSNYEVARAEQFLEQHYAENITVGRLAGLVNMSASSLNRIFKKETGLTPMAYLTKVRIEKSKLLLRRKEIPVTDIAMRCGFRSSAYFSTCFMHSFHVTPTEYRSKYK